MSTPISFGTITPILRVYDLEKTREFYCGFLGCSIDWEHRFDDDAPVYMQASRAGMLLHLTQHHGDCSPNAHVRIAVTGIETLHAELNEKKYKFMRPGLETAPWGERTVTVIDPVGNRLTFFEPLERSG